MKRLLLLIVICIPLFLAGCLSPSSARIVNDMYEAALMEEEENVASYFSEEYIEAHSIDELTNELAEDVRAMYGVKMMNITLIRNRELKDDYIESIGLSNDQDLYVVTAQTDEREVMVWIVERGDTQYSIIYGERYDFDTYNDIVLE
ncbi:hypothetical protein [Oceanobacillus jeddahense]|uniref:DUF3887 domain-containing protein n=1 Tax=Oceanobacillus jeddahense TaxID=1462527 RepID=A0ABY5JQ58_9BACI|nr:hypothetical protein [Oceanobacillus jeddahense]UUI02236.1 hypothetical protein NP439_19665 [Oceanobacillus jeddahense]